MSPSEVPFVIKQDDDEIMADDNESLARLKVKLKFSNGSRYSNPEELLMHSQRSGLLSKNYDGPLDILGDSQEESSKLSIQNSDVRDSEMLSDDDNQLASKQSCNIPTTSSAIRIPLFGKVGNF
jgi:hypothetical protein